MVIVELVVMVPTNWMKEGGATGANERTKCQEAIKVHQCLKFHV